MINGKPNNSRLQSVNLRKSKSGPKKTKDTAYMLFTILLTMVILSIVILSIFTVHRGSQSKHYINAGDAHHNKGEYEKAIADYSRAIGTDTHSAEAYYTRGNSYFEMGKYDHALADYSKAIELNPDFADAYYGRGYALLKKGEYDRGWADFDKAIALNN